MGFVVCLVGPAVPAAAEFEVAPVDTVSARDFFRAFPLSFGASLAFPFPLPPALAFPFPLGASLALTFSLGTSLALPLIVEVFPFSEFA